MKNVIKFLLFIIYSTIIFFLPNNKFILLFIIFHLFIIFFYKIQFKKIITKSVHILPFIIFTFLINCILDNLSNALWMGIKLFIVCNITIIYSEITSVFAMAETIKLICSPLKILKVNVDEIKVMVSISLSMIPILRKEVHEIREACVAKNIVFNVKNMKIILSKFLISLITRVNNIEESLIAKGYSNE